MGAIKPLARYSKKQVNRAGEALRDATLTDAERSAAREIVSDWRDTHQLPIARFQEHLARHAAAVDGNSLVVSRLKRLPTIINKLERQRDMKLSTMQDVGGLRAIVDSPALADELGERLLTIPQFDLKRQRDYIRTPPASGYRGIHHVYAYRIAENDPPSVDGLYIELQIRSRLQHAWATAVEVVGTFRGELLKAGEGSSDWLRFFTLAGALVATKDGTPLGSHIPTDERAFRGEFLWLRESLCVFERLKAYSFTPLIIRRTSVDAHYFVLTSNIDGRYMSTSAHPASDFEGARRAYRDAEQQFLGNSSVDTVLVTASDLAALAEAYPNYWADTRLFADIVYEDSPRR